jgi:hypothetical protein
MSDPPKNPPDDPLDGQAEEPGISWTLIGVIIVIFLCFTIIPALIFFSDRSPPPIPR